MFRIWLSTLVAVLLVASAMAGEKPDEAKLIAIIQSDAPPQDKAIPCKQLAVWGTKAAVPALAALLPNKELSSWARIALEAIPDPAADEALRQAVGKLEGRLLVGVINSIGVRRDPKAIDTLVAKLKDPDPEVASAAAEALGRIGGEQPIKALEPLLASAPPAVRSSVAYGCVLCAEKLLADKKAEDAAKLYDAVRKADVPKYRIAEGTRGAILARGAAGVPLLLEQLRSADKSCFWLGLRVARELPGSEATEALVAELGKAAPEMGALEHMGDASCVPILLEAAADADAELAAAGKVALARLPGPDVDAALMARLGEAKDKALALLVELAGLRRIEAALPALVKNAENADAAVRAAAVAALGSLGGEKQVPDLVKVLQKTQDAADQSAIEKALVAICGRGGAACTPLVMPLAKGDNAALRAIGLRALAAAGVDVNAGELDVGAALEVNGRVAAADQGLVLIGVLVHRRNDVEGGALPVEPPLVRRVEAGQAADEDELPAAARVHVVAHPGGVGDGEEDLLVGALVVGDGGGEAGPACAGEHPGDAALPGVVAEAIGQEGAGEAPVAPRADARAVGRQQLAVRVVRPAGLVHHRAVEKHLAVAAQGQGGVGLPHIARVALPAGDWVGARDDNLLAGPGEEADGAALLAGLPGLDGFAVDAFADVAGVFEPHDARGPLDGAEGLRLRAGVLVVARGRDVVLGGLESGAPENQDCQPTHHLLLSRPHRACLGGVEDWALPAARSHTPLPLREGAGGGSGACPYPEVPPSPYPLPGRERGEWGAPALAANPWLHRRRVGGGQLNHSAAARSS